MVQCFKTFLLHTYTQNSLHFNSFSPLTLLSIYIYPPIAFHVKYTDKKRCHLPSILQ